MNVTVHKSGVIAVTEVMSKAEYNGIRTALARVAEWVGRWPEVTAGADGMVSLPPQIPVAGTDGAALLGKLPTALPADVGRDRNPVSPIKDRAGTARPTTKAGRNAPGKRKEGRTNKDILLAVMRKEGGPLHLLKIVQLAEREGAKFAGKAPVKEQVQQALATYKTLFRHADTNLVGPGYYEAVADKPEGGIRSAEGKKDKTAFRPPSQQLKTKSCAQCGMNFHPKTSETRCETCRRGPTSGESAGAVTKEERMEMIRRAAQRIPARNVSDAAAEGADEDPS